MLGWLVEEEGIEPYIPVIDKSERKDGTFSRDDFTYDHQRQLHLSCWQTARPVQAHLQKAAFRLWMRRA
jgi:hypothetical protein